MQPRDPIFRKKQPGTPYAMAVLYDVDYGQKLRDAMPEGLHIHVAASSTPPDFELAARFATADTCRDSPGASR